MSEIRERINRAIKERCGEDPQDRFQILKASNFQTGEIEVKVQWDAYDIEIMGVKI